MGLRIISLAENTAAREDLRQEPGLSLLLEWRDKTILLDTGASDAFLENGAILGKDLAQLDYVVLSHGHSDHSGGLRALCRGDKRRFKLVLNPHFFDKKFVRDQEYLRYIGNDFAEEFLRTANVMTIFPLKDTFQLEEGVYILSDFAREASFEVEAHNFVALRGGSYDADQFLDEQALVFDLPQGLAVVTACGHNGIVNICEAARRRLGRPIYAVIGGFHTKESGNERLERTAAYFQEQKIARIACGHCTGDRAKACLEAAATEALSLAAGSEILLD
ncbi:MAG: MBL fold metallo-hydrolase [Peptococcaceae bacterium]|jgi:7,8-dihydropterin-6-yl-methyl-4-(beta-D-ribofuranosyl)aminobenzene 5'-phosphate synthase|nr:MBL fold metallo-hydrolase [Peptococcaceae bacterium]